MNFGLMRCMISFNNSLGIMYGILYLDHLTSMSLKITQMLSSKSIRQTIVRSFVSEQYRCSISGFMALLYGLKAFWLVYVGFSQERSRFLEICGQNFDVLQKSDRTGTQDFETKISQTQDNMREYFNMSLGRNWLSISRFWNLVYIGRMSQLQLRH